MAPRGPMKFVSTAVLRASPSAYTVIEGDLARDNTTMRNDIRK